MLYRTIQGLGFRISICSYLSYYGDNFLRKHGRSHGGVTNVRSGDGGIQKTPEAPATYSEGKEIEAEKWEKVGP